MQWNAAASLFRPGIPRLSLLCAVIMLVLGLATCWDARRALIVGWRGWVRLLLLCGAAWGGFVCLAWSPFLETALGRCGDAGALQWRAHGIVTDRSGLWGWVVLRQREVMAGWLGPCIATALLGASQRPRSPTRMSHHAWFAVTVALLGTSTFCWRVSQSGPSPKDATNLDGRLVLPGMTAEQVTRVVKRKIDVNSLKPVPRGSDIFSEAQRCGDIPGIRGLLDQWRIETCLDTGRNARAHVWGPDDDIYALFFEFGGKPTAIGLNEHTGLSLHRILSPDERPALIVERWLKFEVTYFEHEPLFAPTDEPDQFLVLDGRPPDTRLAILFGAQGDQYGSYPCPPVLRSVVSLAGTTYYKLRFYALGALTALLVLLYLARRPWRAAWLRRVASGVEAASVWLLVGLGATLLGWILPFL
ncbi:MAG: hypothetical protein R3B07_36495 [Polyangiaceae bacterium]